MIIFKINPAIAIGTDLLYAAITKSAGILSHGKMGHIDWNVVKKLMLGSIPASLITTYFLKEIDLTSPITLYWIEVGLGIALLLTAMAVFLQPRIIKKVAEKKIKHASNTKILTILLGLILVCVVTLTSVGAFTISRDENKTYYWYRYCSCGTINPFCRLRSLQLRER